MKILVSVKRVVDYSVHIRVKSDQTGVDIANVKMSMNPFDEIAMEEAIRLKEKGLATEVVAISIGTQASQETLRSALAMGADKAILVQTEQEMQPLTVAKILQAMIAKEEPQLIILGKQSIDSDHNQVGQMLAGLLNWPQGTFVSAIQIENDTVTVTREIDGGLEILNINLPAVITTDLRLNEPRYLSLPNIVQAKRKPLEVISMDELKIDIHSSIKTLAVTPPEKRSAGIKVDNVKELIKKLKEEARVIS